MSHSDAAFIPDLCGRVENVRHDISCLCRVQDDLVRRRPRPAHPVALEHVAHNAELHVGQSQGQLEGFLGCKV